MFLIPIAILFVALPLLVSAKDSLNVALLVVGEFRSFAVTKHSIARHFLQAPANLQHHVDVFVSSYDRTISKDTEPSPYAQLVKKVCCNR